MNLVLDIASSAEFWRQRYPSDRSPKETLSLPLAPEHTASTYADVIKLIPSWVDAVFLAPTNGNLHVLALGDARSRSYSTLTTHVWSGRLPEGSLYELKQGLYVESPAFMFLHAATVLSFPQLIAFGDELCGHYSFDAREERGFKKRPKQLLTKEPLARYLQQCKGCPGSSIALRALPHIVEHSASPMETLDEMTLCLPFRYGGYAIPQPEMNHLVLLKSSSARIANRTKCYLDMGYPGEKLDVEHHGKLDHTSDADKESDFARVSGLKDMGFEVIELTSAQVGNLATYELIIKRIAKKLGKRLPPQKLGATEQRLELRRELFSWNQSGGRIRK